MTTYNELIKKWSQQLEIYDPSEAESLLHWLLEHHLGMRRVDMMHFLEEKDLPEALIKDFERLKSGEPIQYILGKSPFYGREFLVNSATLIPRNETEELVHLIIKENPQQGLRILDIGTGTGCIPISLYLEMKSPEVYALDISPEALEVARKNAKSLKAEVNFLQVDILSEKIPLENLDILVSNPPYIPEKGKAEMHKNVLDYEPGLALFVPDEDPLMFYRRIAELGREHLKKGGKLYFEIHEAFGSETLELLESMAYQKVRLIQDLNGKNRIVAAVWEA